MANQITLSAGLTVTASGATVGGTVSTAITQAGANNIGNIQSIGTTTEALVFGDVASIGYLFVKNLDATNYVEFDLNTPVSTTAFAKLLPGEAMLIPTRQSTIYGKANTAGCNCFVLAVDL